MAITVEHKSAQLTKVDNRQLIAKQETRVPAEADTFLFNTTDDLTDGASLVQGDNVSLVEIKADDIPTKIVLNWEAMGAGATLDLGVRGSDGSGFTDKAGTVADDDDFYLVAEDVSAAGELVIDITTLASFDKDVELVANLDGAIWAADKDLKGLLWSIRA